MIEYKKLLRLLNGSQFDKMRLKVYLQEQILLGNRLNTGHYLMLKQLNEEKIDESKLFFK